MGAEFNKLVKKQIVTEDESLFPSREWNVMTLIGQLKARLPNSFESIRQIDLD